MKPLDTPQRIAIRAIELYRAYLEEDLLENTAQAAAIGELTNEVDLQEEIDFCPPNRSLVDDLEAGHGGFAPGSKGWEGRND